jgi:hypothetical protein
MRIQKLEKLYVKRVGSNVHVVALCLESQQVVAKRASNHEQLGAVDLLGSISFGDRISITFLDHHQVSCQDACKVAEIAIIVVLAIACVKATSNVAGHQVSSLPMNGTHGTSTNAAQSVR